MTEAKRETKCNMDYKIFLILSLILLTPLISATSFGYNYLDNQPSGNITNIYENNTYINQTLELNTIQFETGEPATIKKSWLTSFIEGVSKWMDYYTITEIDNRYSNNTGDQDLSTYVQGNMSSETTTTYNQTNGSALSFDGVNDYVANSNAVGLVRSSATISLWVNLDSTSEKGAFVDVGSRFNGFGLGVGGSDFDNAGNDLIGIYDGVAWFDTNVNIGTGWHHIVMNLTNFTQSYWIDGVLVRTLSDPYKRHPNVPSPYITLGADYNLRYVDCELDEVLIFNRSLSENEISQLYNSGNGLYANTSIAPFNDGLVAGYHFDEGSGTTAIDITGRNNGTLVNGPSWVSGKVPHNITTQVLEAIGLMPWVSATNFISTDFSLQWIGNTLKNPWKTISTLGNSTNKWNVHLNNVTMNGTQGWSGNCVNSSILNGIIVGCND